MLSGSVFHTVGSDWEKFRPLSWLWEQQVKLSLTTGAVCASCWRERWEQIWRWFRWYGLIGNCTNLKHNEKPTLSAENMMHITNPYVWTALPNVTVIKTVGLFYVKSHQWSILHHVYEPVTKKSAVDRLITVPTTAIDTFFLNTNFSKHSQVCCSII